jgi:hypothetical protein
MYDSIWATVVSWKLVEWLFAVSLLCAVAFEAYLAFLPVYNHHPLFQQANYDRLTFVIKVFQYSSERLSLVSHKGSQRATSVIHTISRVTRDFVGFLTRAVG